jgi:hypothetical protein
MLSGEYAREALKQGLGLEAKLGTNPYQFGMVGSTDTHTSLSTAEEENYFGKAPVEEPSLTRALHPFAANDIGEYPGWSLVASGYTGVWATENTREAIWDAMERKEVYATTGPRMMVRFFGGWEFDDNDLRSRAPAFAGYEKGVPMGGDLRAAPEGAEAPTFMVYALRDPIGANLDRIQIVKGWRTPDGELHERVYDVAWSDGREPGADGKLPPVGNTVDLEAANWTNTIGASELATVWTDPDFDPAAQAFYYARVIEIPTPRWVLYDKVRLGAEIPEEATLTGQERAYTSPIWYTPACRRTDDRRDRRRRPPPRRRVRGDVAPPPHLRRARPSDRAVRARGGLCARGGGARPRRGRRGHPPAPADEDGVPHRSQRAGRRP